MNTRSASQNASQENINIWLSQINNDYKAAISVDCVIFGYDDSSLKVLVLKSDMPPYEGLPSLVGDLVKPSETLEEAAHKILKQRTGFSNLYMEQVATFSDIGRHPLARVVSTAFYALMKIEDFNGNNSLYEGVYWEEVDKLTQMAFDHKKILEVCLNRLKVSVREKPIGFELLPVKFTLKELQNLYEIILGIKLDKRNFRRKLKALDILVELSEHQEKVSHRPAKLYSLDREAYNARKRAGFSFDL